MAERSIEARLQELCDKQALLELNLRYCRAVDRCDLALLLSCFHPDAVDDHGTFRGSPAEIFPAILEKMRGMAPAQHILDNALFEVAGDLAWGELYMSVRTADADAASPPDAFGRNLDRYERRDGEWRIAERRVIIERFFPDRAVDRTKFLAGRKDRLDPSYLMRS